MGSDRWPGLDRIHRLFVFVVNALKLRRLAFEVLLKSYNRLLQFLQDLATLHTTSVPKCLLNSPDHVIFSRTDNVQLHLI